MKKLTIIFVISLLAILLAGGGVFAAMTSGGGYQIWADVISVGGIDQSTSGGGFYLDDTLGEVVVGKSSSSGSNIGAGFQEMVKGDILSLSISPTSLPLGNLSSVSTTQASHSLYLQCNAAGGVDVTFSGVTLTNSTNTIAGIGASSAAANPGTSQFGFNAIRTSSGVSNSVGAYATAGQYAFNSGATIISSAAAMSAQEDYTLTYIANISTSQASGAYSSAITYTALASF